jgi:KTSC domain
LAAAGLNINNSSTMTLIEVQSSAIRAVGYDGQTLTVVFHSGQPYDHPNVPYDVFVGFMNAPSLGEYYNRYIHGRYR